MKDERAKGCLACGACAVGQALRAKREAEAKTAREACAKQAKRKDR